MSNCLFYSFFEPLPKSDYQFGIRHFSGRVVYDTADFLPSNRDHLPDDIMWVLSKQNCNFGFATHLFNQEIKMSRGIGIITLKNSVKISGFFFLLWTIRSRYVSIVNTIYI